jgi:hypothetical protein
MRYARQLLESRPYLSRVPDQTLIASEIGKGGDHLQATRGDGYALLYLPESKPVTVALPKLKAEKIRASWFDPRTGNTTVIGTFGATEAKEFTPPSADGPDWVLVIDVM